MTQVITIDLTTTCRRPVEGPMRAVRHLPRSHDGPADRHRPSERAPGAHAGDRRRPDHAARRPGRRLQGRQVSAPPDHRPGTRGLAGGPCRDRTAGPAIWTACGAPTYWWKAWNCPAPREASCVSAPSAWRSPAQTYPCARMEEAQAGLLSALAKDWRGGVTCRVLEGGPIALGDPVEVTVRPPRVGAGCRGSVHRRKAPQPAGGPQKSRKTGPQIAMPWESHRASPLPVPAATRYLCRSNGIKELEAPAENGSAARPASQGSRRGTAARAAAQDVGAVRHLHHRRSSPDHRRRRRRQILPASQCLGRRGGRRPLHLGCAPAVRTASRMPARSWKASSPTARPAMPRWRACALPRQTRQPAKR